MTWQAYEAQITREKMSGQHPEAIVNVVEEVMRHGAVMKREEIIFGVHCRTGIDVYDVGRNINTVLHQLEKRGKVIYCKVGFWRWAR